MEKYYKNAKTLSRESAELSMTRMDKFVKDGSGGQPRLDPELIKIWNNGDRLDYEFYEKSQQEIDQEEKLVQSKIDQINLYKDDLELWLDRVARPMRDNAMVLWFDSIRSKPELWNEQSDGVKEEALSIRQTLLDWPSTFTEYVENPELPEKPSYIT